jgi:hypothetical protein
MVWKGFRVWLAVGAICLQMLAAAGVGVAADIPGDVFPTYGVHNDAHADLCAQANCLYRRAKGEPSDPVYPKYWSSRWQCQPTNLALLRDQHGLIPDSGLVA